MLEANIKGGTRWGGYVRGKVTRRLGERQASKQRERRKSEFLPGGNGIIKSLERQKEKKNTIRSLFLCNIGCKERSL